MLLGLHVHVTCLNRRNLTLKTSQHPATVSPARSKQPTRTGRCSRKRRGRALFPARPRKRSGSYALPWAPPLGFPGLLLLVKLQIHLPDAFTKSRRQQCSRCSEQRGSQFTLMSDHCRFKCSCTNMYHAYVYVYICIQICV